MGFVEMVHSINRSCINDSLAYLTLFIRGGMSGYHMKERLTLVENHRTHNRLIGLLIHSFIMGTCVAPLQDTTTKRRSQPSHGRRTKLPKNVCWASTYPTSLDRLFKLQKKAVRVITRSSFIAHTSPLFQQLRIFNLDQIRQYQTGIFMYRANHNLLPAIFQNYFINIK